MIVRVGAVLSAVVVVCGVTWAGAQTKRALLIGINTYQPAGTTAQHPAGCAYGRCELGSFENLDGAVNDAQTMADVLTSPKFGFPAKQVVLLTNPALAHPRAGEIVLPAEQTDRAGLLAAMQKYLVDVPRSGDTVVFYAAGHGSLRSNSKGTKMTDQQLNGQSIPMDNTLVPSDAYKGGYDITDREMTQIFNEALDKGIHLTVILDTCHSGGITRGIMAKYRDRWLPFDPRDMDEAPKLQANGQPVTPPTQRAQNPLLQFSAAQDTQTAKEMPGGQEPHGAFTVALVEALEALPADTPASIVNERVQAVMENSQVPDQDPDLDTSQARRREPLFGGAAMKAGNLQTAAIGMNQDGTVTLDAGRVATVGVGSEFTSMMPNSRGQKVELKVTALEGIARSRAEVVSPAGATVKAGDIFEMTKWMPAESAPLLVWHSPANLSAEQVAAAAEQVGAAGVTSVEDPADEPWTHMLEWDGTNWLLETAGSSAPVALGSTLTAQALRKGVPPGAEVWVNLPPSRELAAQLTPSDAKSAVQPAKEQADAHYLLTGVLTKDGPAYAWFHTSDLAAGPPAPGPPDHSPGCWTRRPDHPQQPPSSYPVRSDWVPAGSAGAVRNAAETLNQFASLLAKVHGWLELASSPVDGSRDAYYSLKVVRESGGQAVGDETMHQGDAMKLELTAQGQVTEQRWVYVLDIDCQGHGQVLYPRGYTNNRFPNAATSGNTFALPGIMSANITPPYGIDTMILLSTAEPLPDENVLNFDGVVTRGAESSPQTPLGQLLSDTSAGTRGGPGEVPTNWGVGITLVHSVPPATQ